MNDLSHTRTHYEALAREAEFQPRIISDMTKRYWADPAYRAQLTAERDAITNAWFAEADATARAEQERRWARDERLLMDAGLSDDAIASVLSGEDLPDAELRS